MTFGRSTAPGGLDTSACRSVVNICSQAARRAAEKLVWVRRLVVDGCPRGKLMQYARAYAAAVKIPGERIPPYTTLRNWARLYERDGFAGLALGPCS